MINGKQASIPLRNVYCPSMSKCVNVIALDDGNLSDEKSSKLATDPALEIPVEESLDEETLKLLEKYQVKEPTLTNAQKLAVLKVLQQNDPVFAQGPTDLGLCTVGEHVIDVGDATPINTPPHAMPHHLRPVLREELNELLDLGIIEPSNSEWAAPIVYVKKKDGSWRLCVDFRKLNLVAKVCVYPLPRINDVFTILQGSRYFTTIDLAKGFWQIKLADKVERNNWIYYCVWPISV
jgi:hypothetical protein